MLNFLKEKKHPNLDSPEATLYHRELVLKKSFLRQIYTQWYTDFKKRISNLPNGKIVEIGSGGGFAKNIIPQIITSDIIALPHCDMVFSACKMPFPNNSLSAIFMIDVLHHIPCTKSFFHEAERCLRPGGEIFMVEPANTIFSRFIYKNLHHEPFDTTQKDWSFPSSGPLSDANGALPWIILKRDIKKFQKQHPTLFLSQQFEHTPFRYILTGGLSYKSVVPGFGFKFVSFCENLLRFMFPYIGMFQTIIVTKKKEI